MPPSMRFPYRPVAAALAVACYAAGATANPQGGVVKAGSATITANGSRLDIVQSSQRAVIDWRSFSIGTGGQVNFRQAGAGATLNRVTGPEMSAILGRLTANGTVFLVNPNGILIGPGAKIDVGGLVAATANISNENFMAGRYKFDEVVNRNAVIVNRGEITAHAGGLVALVAPGVENSGVIRAELGRVVLASGNRFTLDLFGDKLVTFAVDDKVAARLTDMDGRPLQAYVNQSGKIEADGGSILIAASAAKAVLDNVINTSGVVRARSFVQRAGEIVLNGGDEGAVRVAGTLDAAGRAAGAMGGSVKVLGAEVVLDAGSRIDVAGDVGGGTAFVGGGVQGGGGLPRSSRTAIEAGATVNADALTRGNGGTIVAWSDGATRFAGALSARGGAAGGDGGFVEVSGKRELAFAGAVDAGAPAGQGGRLLLDPEFLIVDSATATSTANTLRSGTRVDLDATNTIEVREPIDGRGGASGAPLTLTAGNRIVVENDIVTNDGEVTLKAGAGGITMNAGSATSLSGGNGTAIHAAAAPITLAAAGNVTAEHLVTSGAVTVTSDTGSVRLNRDLAGPSGDGIGPLAIGAARTVDLKGVKSMTVGTVPGSVTVETTRPGGTITLDGPIDAQGKVTIGNPGLAGDTTIRLRNDIHVRDADIALNGTTWISPIARDDNLILQDGPPFFSTFDGTLFDAPSVQVAVQVTGAGNVRFGGDVLWDGSSIPSAKYLYNTLQPPGFNRGDAVAVAALRGRQSLRPVAYYGLNVRVDKGTVSFGGNAGTFNAAGASVAELPAIGTLVPMTGNGLAVTVTAPRGSRDVSFDGSKNVEVTRFVGISTEPALFFLEVEGPERFASPPASFTPLIGKGAPLVEVDDGNPNLIGPSPRNVAPPSFARFELPAVPPQALPPQEPPPQAPPPQAPPPQALPPQPLQPQPLQPQPLPPLPGMLVMPSPNPAPVVGGDAPERAIAARTRDDAFPGDTLARGGPDDGAPAIQEPLRGVDLGRGGSARGAAQDVFGPAAPLVPTAAAPATADGEYFSQGAFEFVQTLSGRGAQ